MADIALPITADNDVKFKQALGLAEAILNNPDLAKTITSAEYQQPLISFFVGLHFEARGALDISRLFEWSASLPPDFGQQLATLLSLSSIVIAGGRQYAPENARGVRIGIDHLSSLRSGLHRLVLNEDATLYQLSEAIGWFTIPTHTLDLKLNNKSCYNDVSEILQEVTQLIFRDNFFSTIILLPVKIGDDFLKQSKKL